jgi:hypothetical protein
MHLMPSRAQTDGGLEEIPFGATLQIEALMNQRDFHSIQLTM